MVRRRQYPSSWRSDEHSDGGSGELSGDDLARFHAERWTRFTSVKRFRDKRPPKRSWATSSVMVLGRCAYLVGEFYPTSVAPLLEMPRGIEGFSSDLDSLPSWISDHLGEGSPYMTDEIRLPDEGETITSTRPGEVAFYEAAFPAGLRFPIHNTIRLILQFYNICPAQLVPNAWRSIACSMALWRVYKYSITLSEFRNLFSLNCNPKPDKAGYTSRQETRKSCSEDTPTTLRGGRASSFLSPATNGRFPREFLGRAPQEFRGREGFQVDKHCNNPPRLYGDEPKVFEEIFLSVEKSGRFSVPVLLDSKSFSRVFGSRESRTSRTAGDNRPSGEAPSSSGDVGESKNPHDQARRESPSRDDSIECLGSIRTNFRRLLPHIPDLTLLRWLGGNILDPILDRSSNDLSSNFLSESCSDSSLPVELESDAMSKRVNFKKIGEKLGKKTGTSSGTLVLAKGVLIGEKRPGESITSSPSKKGKADDGSKGKGISVAPEAKKKTSSSKAPTIPTAAFPRPGEGSSANLGTVPGPTTSMLGSSSVAEEVAAGGDSPSRQGKRRWCLVHLWSSGVGRQGSRQLSKRGELLPWKLKLLASKRLPPTWNNSWRGPVLVSSRPMTSLPRQKSDRDSLSDKFERSGVLVNELREALNKSKEFAVEEFKSSSEFMVAVEDSASKYFGKGFNFCKVQLRRHHPDLAIDLEGTVVDQDLLAEQDKTEEENDKEKTGENEGGNQK
ncbi:hypothetical protein Acr_10g0005270 [Actinidia rufa]|uniref:Transposase (putative) gypsy type domain-containing protein n=1 Tax=Actinidia rufa TaxID=165716 RepID=A0A7J0F8W4_9ERIC|nr:hypothetical protein Acr_10g0005270 [Actinidia rufa]